MNDFFEFVTSCILYLCWRDIAYSLKYAMRLSSGACQREKSLLCVDHQKKSRAMLNSVGQKWTIMFTFKIWRNPTTKYKRLLPGNFLNKQLRYKALVLCWPSKGFLSRGAGLDVFVMRSARAGIGLLGLSLYGLGTFRSFSFRCGDIYRRDGEVAYRSRAVHFCLKKPLLFT